MTVRPMEGEGQKGSNQPIQFFACHSLARCHPSSFKLTSRPALHLSHPLAAMSSSKMYQSACKAARSLLASSSSAAARSSLLADGRNAALATLTNIGRTRLPAAYSYHTKASGAANAAHRFGWIAGIPAAAYMLQDQEVHAAELERTFIAIKPDGVQRGLISEIVSRFERKGFKLVAIKLVVPSKEFAEKHYHDLKERPFFSGLCDFLSSGPVLAMVWEGEGVIKYGRKLIGATDPQKSEPGTIRGDLAVVVGRNIIHGSDGPETAKDEIALWFTPKELVSYTSNEEKWVYGVN
ncbi:nucleoside diphosphate kinase 3-like [Lolium rigidum]|uniref:nucleoside diphosphate kinase 3-like n=1 Tax=Lolium rigidum TaxID=89674 RepID=UPI001F5DEDE7|nr:nucleoside diphosphate kinase 3-like [Lolium rigidum]